MPKPEVPKVEKPAPAKKPIEPPATQRALARPQGQNALISAGSLAKKPITRKASLLG